MSGDEFEWATWWENWARLSLHATEEQGFVGREGVASPRTQNGSGRAGWLSGKKSEGDSAMHATSLALFPWEERRSGSRNEVLKHEANWSEVESLGACQGV